MTEEKTLSTVAKTGAIIILTVLEFTIAYIALYLCAWPAFLRGIWIVSILVAIAWAFISYLLAWSVSLLISPRKRRSLFRRARKEWE